MNGKETRINEAIKKIVENKSLSEKESFDVCLEIMAGSATPSQIGAFLTALRMKGETIEEITGFCRAMRERMIPIRPLVKFLIDTCGTGGDGMKTFNISTTAAFIAAGAGCFVAKHGNRSVSSLCGSADLISALGLRPDMEYELVKSCIENIGIGFLYAPIFHPAMKNVSNPRKEIGIRTIFNILGPLCNPANVTRQIIGIYRKDFMEKLAGVLMNLGVEHCLVVHGADGIDEITTTTKTYILEIIDKRMTSYEIQPEEFGIRKSSFDELMVQDGMDNLNSFLSVLNGIPGPKTDIAILNAGAAIYVAGKSETIKQGVELARESVFSGAALNKLEELRRFVNGYSKRNCQKD